MLSDEFGQFLLTAVVLTMVVFAVATIVTPPDPYTQVVTSAILLPVALVVSYLFAYRDGFEWL